MLGFALSNFSFFLSFFFLFLSISMMAKVFLYIYRRHEVRVFYMAALPFNVTIHSYL